MARMEKFRDDDDDDCSTSTLELTPRIVNGRSKVKVPLLLILLAIVSVVAIAFIVLFTVKKNRISINDTCVSPSCISTASGEWNCR